MLKSRLKLFFFFALFFLQGISQNFIPIVTQYSKTDYKAGSQNWSVCQDTNKLMFFGNNEGLLSFNGNNFNLIKMPRNQAARSIYIDKNNTIYAGSFEEFGYFQKDKYGNYIYRSLSAHLKNYKMQNDEIWHIIEFKGKIIFQSFTSIFIWDGKTVTGNRYNFTFLYAQEFQNQLYIYSHQNGFCRFNLNSKEFVKMNEVPFRSAVIKLLPVRSNFSYIITESEGIFTFDGEEFTKFNTDAEEGLAKWGVNKAVFTQDSLIVIGTIQNGAFAINTKGKKIWELNTTNVLQNNTVLGMYCDKENNVWLALDKGIAMINLGNSLQFIHSFTPSIGSIYSVAFQNPNLYLATNQGLYRAKLSLADRKITDIRYDVQTRGQIWDIFQADGQLFCGNNYETFEILPNGQNRVVAPVKGGMCMTRGNIYNKEVLVQGTYNEICIYTKENNQWKFSHSLAGFYNPIKTIQVDFQGNIWASHLHKGLYRITLKEDLKTIDKMVKYNTLDGENELPIRVYSINNRVIFSDNNSYYIYDDLHNKIVPFGELNKSIGKFSQSHNVCFYKSTLYWFIKNEEAALVQIRGNDIKIVDRIHFSALQNQTVDNSENIIHASNNYSLLTFENGLGLYTSVKNHINYRMPLLALQRVEVRDKKSLLKENITVTDEKKVKFRHTKNSITFTLSFPYYSNKNDLMFRYRLDGLGEKWGALTSQNVKQYEYLSPGTYTFNAEVLTNEGKVIGELQYRFTVNPPVYWSAWFRMIYLLIFIFMLYMLYRYMKRRYSLRNEKYFKEQEDLRKKEIEKREQQILTLEKEKLETELTLKSKDLAASTMSLIKKNELLTTIKEEIVTLKKTLGNQYPNKYYDKLIKLLDENISSEADWSIFQTNFDRIHENFFRNLHQKYPELTSNDLRFCAYLRLNLSTKDIAHLMNISPKGVEVGRYRIRKKIGIPSTKSLTEFMIEFKE